MSVADDICEGLMCMKCCVYLVSDDGKLCNCGHPVFCSDCWDELPKADREGGAPYFDERSGTVCNGKE